MYELSETMKASTRPAEVQKKRKINSHLWRRGSRHTVAPFDKKAFVLIPLGWENQFSPMECYRVYQRHSWAGPME